MQEPSDIYDPLPVDNEDEAESRMQRALVSYMPEPQQQQHQHQSHRVLPPTDPPAGPSTRGRSVVELSQDILHYVQHKVREPCLALRQTVPRCGPSSDCQTCGVLHFKGLAAWRVQTHTEHWWRAGPTEPPQGVCWLRGRPGLPAPWRFLGKAVLCHW